MSHSWMSVYFIYDRMPSGVWIILHLFNNKMSIKLARSILEYFVLADVCVIIHKCGKYVTDIVANEYVSNRLEL